MNGLPADDLLPAIMITDCEPASLAQASEFGPRRQHRGGTANYPERFIILPLRELCKTASDVALLLEKITQDLESGTALQDFEVARLVDETEGGAAEMLSLQPNIAGVGVDLKMAFEWGKAELQKRFGREAKK